MEPKEVIGSEEGIITDILSDIPGIGRVVAWPEATGNAQMYKVLDKDKKVSYMIKQYCKRKSQDGLEFKERAMKEKEISDQLCQYIIPIQVEQFPQDRKSTPRKILGQNFIWPYYY